MWWVGGLISQNKTKDKTKDKTKINQNKLNSIQLFFHKNNRVNFRKLSEEDFRGNFKRILKISRFPTREKTIIFLNLGVFLLKH